MGGRVLLLSGAKQSIRANHIQRSHQQPQKSSLLLASDNILLEHRLALEMYDRGLIERIIPVYIGDKKDVDQGIAEYSDYFLSNCMHTGFASCSRCVQILVVLAVEDQLRGHLERLCLGPPVQRTVGVTGVFERVTQFARPKVKGPDTTAFKCVIDAIVECVQALN